MWYYAECKVDYFFMSKISLKNTINVLIVLILFAISCIAGIYTGNAILDRRNEAAKQQNIDETIGLGEHTGITGELLLYVDPVKVVIRRGQPAFVTLTLKNNTKKDILINGWLILAPARFGSNQLPLKQTIRLGGKDVDYKGSITLYPPHKKDDFIKLKPGKEYKFKLDITKGAGNGEWKITRPGIYEVELWYETYLTGKYSGVNAWTGMTNHVVVKLQVLP